MRHIIEAQLSYLARWRGENAEGDAPDIWSLGMCKEREQTAARAWQCHLTSIGDGDLGWELEQVNPQGKFRLDATNMMIHVVIHGFYHRAQIDSMLRQSGREPPRAGYAFLARRRVK